MEVQPNARVQVYKHPPAAPGKCVVCGFGGDAEDSRTFIDFGFDLDYYGVVYFCSNCIVEVANAIGFVSGEQYEAVAKENADLTERLIGATNERDFAIDSLRAFLNGRPGVGSASESEELPKSVPPIEKPPRKQPRPKSKVSSNVEKPRPNDTSDNDGDSITIN